MEDELKDFKIDIQFFAEEGQKPTEEEVDTDNEEVDPLEGLDEATKETINGLQDAYYTEGCRNSYCKRWNRCYNRIFWRGH
jgi:hypothetical protein